MRLEKEEDLRREKRAIELFVSKFGGSYKKLGEYDIDFRVYNKDGELVSYVEVKGRNRKIDNAYPLPISLHKLSKLQDKRLNPIIIWACTDGIIYARALQLYGKIRLSGRPNRKGAVNDTELMVYYDKQKAIKYIRTYDKEEW